MTGIKKHTQSRETCKSRHVYMNSKLFLLFKFVLLLFYHLIISTSCPKKQGTKMSDTISHKKKLQYHNSPFSHATTVLTSVTREISI